MTGADALDRFLGGLVARDVSAHTRRSYATAVGAYLGWLDERKIDWRRPARGDLRAYLEVLSEGHARTSVGAASRRDPVVLPVRRPERPVRR